MKISILFFVLSLFCLSCSGTKTINTSYSKDGSSEKTVTQSNIFGKKDLVKLKEDWVYDMLVANGEAPILKKYKEESRNILLAKKGAVLDAQRKLAEKIGTIRLNATTTMQDFSTSDLVQSRINVFLRDVTIISEEKDIENSTFKVTIQMPKLKVVNILEEYFEN